MVQMATQQILQLQASNWKVLTYTASDSAVTALATQGQLWYSPSS